MNRPAGVAAAAFGLALAAGFSPTGRNQRRPPASGSRALARAKAVRARRGAQRVGLHETQALQRGRQRGRRRQAARQHVVAQVVEGGPASAHAPRMPPPDNHRMPMSHRDPLDGLAVFERGWLSSNNLLVRPARGEPGALLVDTGHVVHADQTVALVRQALGGAPGGPDAVPLARIVNTHLHSDHCGGNAALARAFGAALAIPPGQADAVHRWDEAALSYRATGQRIERFSPQATLRPGEALVAGGREWQVLAAPGHDPHSVLLFDAAHGLLLSADALWGNGFGVVFPELEGESGFDEVEATLDLIAGLPVRVVVPGHGPVFDDVADALARARRRLAGLRADPARHAAWALKALTKYHVMEERRQALPALLDWAEATPLFQALWQRFAPRGVASLRDWSAQVVAELAAQGALRRDGDEVVDA
jgi:glyoxylase-like metal-dependent hydrolase (beta-lactamase superfamily II)